MKLPSFIPQVRCPWNLQYKEVWISMTPNERRWSFLIDTGVVAFVILLLIWSEL